MNFWSLWLINFKHAKRVFGRCRLIRPYYFNSCHFLDRRFFFFKQRFLGYRTIKLNLFRYLLLVIDILRSTKIAKQIIFIIIVVLRISPELLGCLKFTGTWWIARHKIGFEHIFIKVQVGLRITQIIIFTVTIMFDSLTIRLVICCLLRIIDSPIL
jgi:hypothetical protein